MQLIDFELGNYRLHKQILIEFCPGLNVVIGANESGKSTLVEGLHRALFLPARCSGSLLEEMRAKPTAGDPEITLRFKAGLLQYTLRKRFAGPRGSTSLISSAGNTWQGDKAEDELAELVGAAAVQRARVGEQLRERWGHLWVWQGTAGLNPLDLGVGALDQKKLLEQLQDSGQLGIQSQLDQRVVELVQQRWSNSFTDKGRIGKAGSHLAMAQREEQQAKEHLSAINKLLQEQQEARDNQFAASASLAELDQLIPLLLQLEPLELQKAQLINQLKPLNDLKEQLSSLQLESNSLKNKLEPLILSRDQMCKQIPIVEQERNGANNILDSTVREAEQLQQAIRKATIEEKLLSLEANIQRDKELRQLLLDLPDINLGIVEQLRDKQQQLKLAEITMQSLATKVELLMAESAVYVNGEPLNIGSSTCLNSTSILQTAGLELRIIPGDGGKVAQAMAKHEFLESSLNADLRRLRVENIEQAVHLERHRSELLAEQQRLQAEKASESVEDLRGALEKYINDQLPIASIDDLRKQLDDLVPIGRERRQVFNQLDNKLTNQREQLANCNQLINIQQEELVKTNTLLKELLKRFGSVDEVDSQLSKLNLNISELEKRQEVLKKQLSTDFPGYKGLNSSYAIQQREVALQKVAAAGALLRADGINDRYAQREQLEAAFEARTSERERLEQDALMLDLLRQLLQEEQTAMALQYTEPVTKKLDSYLSCCFPGPMQSSLEYQSNKGFINLQWQRGDSAVAWEFSALSGGTKEILAASLRLAMAEVLANAYSGCLPLVFDDAFSNVDPSRWPWVSALLQKGANQGLQLILFSCDPTFCEALPANQRLQLP